MSVETIDLRERDLLRRAVKHSDLSVHELAQLRKAELQFVDARTPREKQEDEAQKNAELTGKKLAQKAVQFLTGQADSHRVEFHVGHSFEEAHKTHSLQHDGYIAAMAVWASVEGFDYDEASGLYVSDATDRVVQRVELFPDMKGQAGVIRYIDSDQQRELEVIATDPMRLIAQA